MRYPSLGLRRRHCNDWMAANRLMMNQPKTLRLTVLDESSATRVSAHTSGRHRPTFKQCTQSRRVVRQGPVTQLTRQSADWSLLELSASHTDQTSCRRALCRSARCHCDVIKRASGTKRRRSQGI